MWADPASLSQLDIEGGPYSGTILIDPSSFTSLADLNLENGGFSGGVLTMNGGGVSSLKISNCNYTGVSLTSFGSLNSLIFDSCPFTSFDYSAHTPTTPLITLYGAGCVSLATVDISGFAGQDIRLNAGAITSFTCADADLVNVVFLELSSNALPQADVDTILIGLDNNGLSGGLVNLSLGTNAAPSGFGAAAVVSLLSKGWTVTTN